ncbi:uncharacterized protein MELLADRAFT_92365 [Melampsora larici-populina 98AG31]|uniref:Uncharacterized protein n=1 Tax=Melampsora larici-populina (strain 98AG31 / pathotype 3-4-7) TaxID=747676 RepID=F4R9D1_MELLP|nr:uncharacterized protein MELLADRAFT_92365 [Melampsora larici-populina 98AG31]EGG10964.1 hypothetical protein MELLADRAFT_92365 [Melampsora larici-populina 98AG31]
MMSDSSFTGPFDSQGGGDGFQSPSTLTRFNSLGGASHSNAGPFDSQGGGGGLSSLQRFNSQGGVRNPNTERTTRESNCGDLTNGHRGRDHRSVSPSRRGSFCREDSSCQSLGHIATGHGGGRHQSQRPDDRTDDLPLVFAEPLVGESLIVFNAMADHYGLDDKHRTFALAHAEVFGENSQHFAGATFQSMLLMEISRLHNKIDTLANRLATGTSGASAPGPIAAQEQGAGEEQQVALPASNPTEMAYGNWKSSPKLVGLINPMALKFLWSPLLEAYTAVSNKAEGYLPNSLFNMIKKTVAKETIAFKAQYLPANRQGVEHATDTQSYATALRDAGKHGREKLHNVLLSGIHDAKSKEVVGTPVPCIKKLVKKVAVRCGTVGEEADLEAVWAATDQATRARIAYMRREAARIIVKGPKGSESVWANIDTQLALLRARRDENYAAADSSHGSFYELVFKEDKKYFPGTVWFKTIKAEQRAQDKALDFPSEEAILERMAQEAARRAGNPGSSNTGNQLVSPVSPNCPNEVGSLSVAEVQGSKPVGSSGSPTRLLPPTRAACHAACRRKPCSAVLRRNAACHPSSRCHPPGRLLTRLAGGVPERRLEAACLHGRVYGLQAALIDRL